MNCQRSRGLLRTVSGFAVLGLLALVLPSGAAFAAADKSADPAVVQLDTVEVTGSRIKRGEVDGPQPLVVYTEADIEANGGTTFSDFAQSLAFNSAGMASLLHVNSVTPGLTTLNPRGLGTWRYLALIDGRRVASYAVADSFNRSAFDLNCIPREAVEKVEFLKDGGSAIYGSDAITGVMNVKLKRSFQGRSLSVMAGNTLGHDTFSRGATVSVGAQASPRTSVLAVASWFKDNASLLQDYDRSRTTDYSGLGALKGLNQNSTANFPANVTLTAAQASLAGLAGGAGYYVVTGGRPVAIPTAASFTRYASATATPSENRYDFASVVSVTPELDYRNLFVRARHDFGERLGVFGQLLATDNRTLSYFSPSVANSGSVLTSANTYLIVPRANPYNPFGSDLNNFNYRTNFGPTRMMDVHSEALSALGGVNGKLGRDWSWESAYGFSRNGVTMNFHNFVKADDLQAALAGTTRATALNPFGPSENPAVASRLFLVSPNYARTALWTADFSATGRLGEMPALLGQAPAGPINLALGGEWRREEIDQRPDPVSYIGWGGRTPFFGSRHVESAFADLSVPLVRRQLELEFAGRHEKFSDFGSSSSPKFGFVAQPLRWLKVRGTFSRSFKAPDLGLLNSQRLITYTTTTYADPLRPQDPPAALRIISGGNPSLQPERGKTWYGGVVLQLDPKSRYWSFSADYMEVTIDRAIVTNTSPSVFFNYYPNRVIRDSARGNPGPILYLDASPDNVSAYAYRGFDFGLAYKRRGARFGDLNVTLNATRIMYYGYDGGVGRGMFNFVGRHNQPRWTGEGRAQWSFRDFGAGLSAQFKGPYRNDNTAYSTVGWGENPVTKLNVSLSYSGLPRTRITLGVDNVLDTQPPPNGRELDGFDINTYAAWGHGRFVTLRVKKEF
ncbi:MAG: TonB-dependent receptor [Opitutae bacterium]|nr:TonB-dependent receptor [Opitutae bacterium]